MKTTADFLNDLRVKFSADSDYKAMSAIGIKHRQQISRYRTLQTTFDDETAMRIADVLETDPAFVVACMHAQRAKRIEEKQLWERIAGMAAVALIVISLPYTVQLSDSSTGMLMPTLFDITSFDITQILANQNIHYANIRY